MKLLFTTDWLKRTITADPEGDVEAGPPLVDDTDDAANITTMPDRNVVQLRMALGVFVRQLRLRDGLSVTELAQAAHVSEEELRQVEHNPNYTAGLRLIYQLSSYFKVSLENLSQMAGATNKVNKSLYNKAMKYAARSDDISILTDEEREGLDAFVAILNERAGT